MSFKHTHIWQAIDRLAERYGFSPSGLAKEAGLSPTAFNPSKRATKNRKHWPSTESIARILHATGATFEEFVELTSGNGGRQKTIPLLGFAQASRENAFDDNGHPTSRGWEDIKFPRLGDPNAFALEITGKHMEPVFREGDRIVVSPAEKPRRGDRVLVRTRKGEVIARQLGRESASSVELLPLGGGTQAVTMPAREIEWLYRIVWVSQ